MEKTKNINIIDILLCGLYMAVFCVPTIYLSIGIVKYTDWNMIVTFLCPIMCGVLSCIAMFSDSKKKAAQKWAASVPFSAGMFFVLANSNLLARIYRAVDPSYYAEYGMGSMGEAFSGTALLFMVLIAVFIGNIIGLCCSGIKLTRNGENVFAVLHKIICPIFCVIIVSLIVCLFFVLPEAVRIYG